MIISNDLMRAPRFRRADEDVRPTLAGLEARATRADEDVRATLDHIFPALKQVKELIAISIADRDRNIIN